VEAVHVLDGGDGGEYPVLVDMGREGKLDEDPVHAVVLVEASDQLQQLRFRRLRR
jgi:hypothetical protein